MFLFVKGEIVHHGISSVPATIVIAVVLCILIVPVMPLPPKPRDPWGAMQCKILRQLQVLPFMWDPWGGSPYKPHKLWLGAIERV